MILNNLPSRPRVALLDFDGFLVHSMHVIYASYRYAYEKMKRPVPTDVELVQNLRGSGLASFPAIFKKRSNTAWEHYDRYYRKIHLLPDSGISPIDGAKEFLAVLHAANIPVVIVTNKLAAFTEDEIEYLGWNKYIRFVVGSGDAGDATTDKPAPDLLHLAVARLGLMPNTLDWVAGDTRTDILAAKKYGCVPILVNDKPASDDASIYHFSSMLALVKATQTILCGTPTSAPVI